MICEGPSLVEPMLRALYFFLRHTLFPSSCCRFVSLLPFVGNIHAKLLQESPRQNLPKQTNIQGAVKGVYLKGVFAQSRLFHREMDWPVRFHREMDCPVRWSLAAPSALESQFRAEQGSVVANPICKCRRHKAGHLQVRVAVGRRSTCALKEAPLNKGLLGFPQTWNKNPRRFSAVWPSQDLSPRLGCSLQCVVTMSLALLQGISLREQRSSSPSTLSMPLLPSSRSMLLQYPVPDFH